MDFVKINKFYINHCRTFQRCLHGSINGTISPHTRFLHQNKNSHFSFFKLLNNNNNNNNDDNGGNGNNNNFR